MDPTCALLADNLCDDEFDALPLANCEEHATKVATTTQVATLNVCERNSNGKDSGVVLARGVVLLSAAQAQSTFR